MSMLKDFWLRQRINASFTKAGQLSKESSYVRLDHLNVMLSKLPFNKVDANIAATQHIWVMDTDFNQIISMLQTVNLKLETNQHLTPVNCSTDMTTRTLDSLFISNKTYVSFDRIAVFITECAKLIKLTHGIRTANVGKDEYHYRILTNMFTTCVNIHEALLENLKYGRYGS